MITFPPVPMNFYIWMALIDGLICLYAGRTSRSIEARTRQIAYVGPNSRPIMGKEIKIMHRERHTPDTLLNELSGRKEEGDFMRTQWGIRYNNDIGDEEEKLINSIEAVQQMHPDRIKVLNTNRAGYHAGSDSGIVSKILETLNRKQIDNK